MQNRSGQQEIAKVSDTNTQAEAKTKRKVAEKEFVDAAGKPTTQELATGISYKSLADPKEKAPSVYQIPGAVAGSIITMLALFGTTTLATNAASANRGSDNPNPSDADFVMERLAQIVDGDWGAERGGGGFAIDQESLVAAMVEIRNAAGNPITDVAKLAKRVADDEAFRKEMAKHSAIKPTYERLLDAKRGPKKEADITAALADF